MAEAVEGDGARSMKNRHILEAIIICVLTLIVVSVGIHEVGATTPDTRLRIEPADLAVSLNETFVVNVVVEEVNNLAAFEFDLAYDPSILQVTEATASDFLKSTGNSVVAMGPEVNDAGGKITSSPKIHTLPLDRSTQVVYNVVSLIIR